MKIDQVERPGGALRTGCCDDVHPRGQLEQRARRHNDLLSECASAGCW